MNREELIKYWKEEESAAVMSGWDFRHIEGRYRSTDDELPWDYGEVVRRHLRSTDKLLDIDTGGGEYLLTLGHPYALTSATEGYPPNAELCRRELGRLGIDFYEMSDYSAMPFGDGEFDIVINRHGTYDAAEIYRILKSGGYFITQQVGWRNDRELIQRLLPESESRYKGHELASQAELFRESGFIIEEQGEIFSPIEFYDTGALVWFAGVIPWEFEGFSVDRCESALFEAEAEIQRTGRISGNIHRFYIAARKP